MRDRARELALTAGAVVVLSALGWGGSAAPPAPVAVADPNPPTASTLPGPPDTLPFIDPATTTTSLVASVTPQPAAPELRPLEIRVYPTAAEAELTVTDSLGTTVSGVSAVSTELAGRVEIEISAAGYRPEVVTVEADTGGVLELYLDPPDQAVDRHMVMTTGSSPKQVAFTPDGSELWVTLLAGSGLEVYDPYRGALVAAVDLPHAGSVEVIFDAAGTTAYVSQMETATIYEIDVSTHRITSTLETGGAWTKVMVLSPDETRLYASNWLSNDVSEFDLATGQLLRRIPTVPTPRGLATDTSGKRLYVAGYDDGHIQMIDLESGEGTVLEHTGGAMRHLVADHARGVLYASDMARDSIFVVDMTTDSVATLVSTDRLPNTIDLSPNGSVLAVSNRGRNNPDTYYLPGPQWGSIQIFDVASGDLLDAVVGGNQPTGLDISADGRWLAYSDFLDNRVTVLALPTPAELRAAGGGRSSSYRAELDK